MDKYHRKIIGLFKQMASEAFGVDVKSIESFTLYDSYKGWREELREEVKEKEAAKIDPFIGMTIDEVVNTLMELLKSGSISHDEYYKILNKRYAEDKKFLKQRREEMEKQKYTDSTSISWQEFAEKGLLDKVNEILQEKGYGLAIKVNDANDEIDSVVPIKYLTEEEYQEMCKGGEHIGKYKF